MIDLLIGVDLITTKVLDNIDGDKSMSFLSVTKDINKLIVKKNPILTLPIFLPMIVPPLKYGNNISGGYILNEDNPDGDTYLSIPFMARSMSYGENSMIQKDNIIYNSINNMMNVPFKVNIELLNYLLRYNYKHKLLIDFDYVHPLSEKKDRKNMKIVYIKVF